MHEKIFADADFRAGQFDTKFMERFFARQAEKAKAETETEA
jgi:acetyl-CoA carboxylase biotin carboxylase subunit